MRSPHTISGLLRLSKKLTQEKLETLISDHENCPVCCHKFKRYRWVEQGGPWLWCPQCGWAGDAFDYGAVRFGEDRGRILRMVGIEPDDQSTSRHRELTLWRSTVRVILDGSAGADRSLLNTDLFHLGVRVPDVEWSNPLTPDIGVASTHWMTTVFPKWIKRVKLDRYLVAPIEIYPGLYVGLAVVNSERVSSEDFGRLEVVNHHGDSSPTRGWIGLSAAARANGQLGTPVFSRTVDWSAWSFRDYNYSTHFPAVVPAGDPKDWDWRRLVTVITPIHVQPGEDIGLVRVMEVTGGKHCFKLDRNWTNHRIHRSMSSARTKDAVVEGLPVAESTGRASVMYRGLEIREGPDGWYVGEERVSDFRIRLTRRLVRADGVRTQRWKGLVLTDNGRLPFTATRSKDQLQVDTAKLSEWVSEKLTCKYPDFEVLKLASKFGGFDTVGPARLGWHYLKGFTLSGLTVRPSGEVAQSIADPRVVTRGPDIPSVRRVLRNRTNMQLAAIVCTTVACGYFDIKPKCVSIRCVNLRFRRILSKLGARVVPRLQRRTKLENLQAKVVRWIRSGWPTVFALYERPDRRVKMLNNVLSLFRRGNGALIVRDKIGDAVSPGWVKLEIRKVPQRIVSEGLDSVLSTYLVWLTQKKPEAKTYEDVFKLYGAWLKSIKVQAKDALEGILIT